MYKILSALPLLLLCAACSTSIPQVTVITVPEIDPAPPQQLDLQPINWQLWNSNDLKSAVFPANTLLFVLPQSEVDKLVANQFEEEGYILQLKQDVLYYKAQNPANQNSNIKK